MIGEKELPGMILEQQPGMHLYHGYLMGRYRFRVYVPTTIFDPITAEIRVYQPDSPAKSIPDAPEKVVAQDHVPLQSMPRWDARYQTLQLNAQDERTLEKRLRKLERKLLQK